MFLVRITFLLFSGLFFMAVTATALASFLVLTGAPRPCVNRALMPAPAPNPALQANWSSSLDRIGAGEAVALSVTEDQATSLAAGHLEGKNLPIDDLVVIFCPDGSTEAFGRVTVAGISSDVLVKGSLDVSGDQPVVRIEAIKAGNLPSAIAENLLDLVWDGEEARRVPLDVSIYSIDARDGEAIVVVGP